MEQPGRPVFWTNMTRQSPGMDAGGAQSPTSAPPDPSRTPPCSHLPDGLLDGEKTTAMLLFSGVALAVVGVPFTFMGWRYQQSNPTFEWLKLLGPILISVGLTFALTSICKFGTSLSWLSCRQGPEDVLVMTVTEQSSRGHCCTISGRNQPIMIHDVTTILCAPPEYNFVAPGGEFQPGGIHADADRREKNVSSSSRPPAYDDIFPPFDAHSQS